VNLKHMTPDQRLYQAQRPEQTADVLSQLAVDVSETVRRAVALRSALPADLMAQMTFDPSLWVRADIAQRRDLPMDLVVQLAADPSVVVRAIVAAAEGRSPSFADFSAARVDVGAVP